MLVTNKGSVALVPRDCNKRTGLLAAIADLGADGVPIIAIGDAENDLPMFAVATIAVGVANADDAVRTSGVELTHAARAPVSQKHCSVTYPPAPRRKPGRLSVHGRRSTGGRWPGRR